MTVHSRIQNNSQEIARLYQQLQLAIAARADSPHKRSLWEAACAEFHARYEELAFPGGPRNARHRLRAGDPVAIEYALAFLEIRPYFFRSGYMYKEFMRVLRNCPLSVEQRQQYDSLREAYMDYRTRRRNAKQQR